MNNPRPLLIAAIALTLATTAFAQDITPPPPGSAIVLQPAVMAAGEERTYKIETLITSSIPDGAPPEHSQRIVRLEVVRANEDGLIIVYSQMTNQASAYPKLAQAMRSRQIQFQADPSGYPVRVLNWSGHQADMVRYLQANGGEAFVSAVQGLTEDGVIQNLISDAALIASMQSFAPMAGPKIDETDASTPGLRLLRSQEFEGSRASDCTFVVKKVTQLDPASPAAIEAKVTERLETRAFVSMTDGWVVELNETARRTVGPGVETVLKKVTRQGPKQGACEVKASVSAQQ